MAKPPAPDEDVQARGVRALERHFNTRYQSYNRVVHVFACYAAGFTPEARRASAALHFSKVRPFAIVNTLLGNYSNADAYAKAMLDKGVMQYSAAPFIPNSEYVKNAPLSWGYNASVEQQAAKYASYICQKAVKRNASFSGNPGENGKPRRFGLLYSTSQFYPQLQLFANEVRKQVQRCGGKFDAEATYLRTFSAGGQDGDNPAYAQTNMADFQRKGITTIIWPGGYETNHTRAAASLNYLPEWIVPSDTYNEAYGWAQFQDPVAWAHAWVVADVPRAGSFSQTNQCYTVMRESQPDFPEADARYLCILGSPYESMRQLFTGVQLAGPRLTPQQVNEGFRAIPPKPSTDPATPSCYYEPNDFTCVKDAQAMWWDPAAKAQNSRAGCWKMAEGGRRYTAGQWPAGDVLAQKDITKDVCNGYDPGRFG